MSKIKHDVRQQIETLISLMDGGLTHMDFQIVAKERYLWATVKRSKVLSFYVIPPDNSPFGGKKYLFDLKGQSRPPWKVSAASSDAIKSFNVKANKTTNNVRFEHGFYAFEDKPGVFDDRKDYYVETIRIMIENTFVNVGLTNWKLMQRVNRKFYWHLLESLEPVIFIDDIVATKQTAPDVENGIAVAENSENGQGYKERVKSLEYDSTLEFLKSIICVVHRVPEDVFEVFMSYFGDYNNTLKYYPFRQHLEKLIDERTREWSAFMQIKALDGIETYDPNEINENIEDDSKITVTLVNADEPEDSECMVKLETDLNFDVRDLRNQMSYGTLFKVFNYMWPTSRIHDLNMHHFSMFVKGKRLVVGDKLSTYMNGNEHIICHRFEL